MYVGPINALAGLRSIRRGQTVWTTMVGNKSLSPLDRVQRQFHADRPNTQTNGLHKVEAIQLYSYLIPCKPSTTLAAFLQLQRPHVSLDYRPSISRILTSLNNVLGLPS